MNQTLRGCRPGFTVRDLAALLTSLLIAAGLLAPLLAANRDLSQTTVCTANLRQLFDGLTNYVNQYNSFPPHNPYPQAWWPADQLNLQVNGYDTGGWDPNLGWVLTYGLGLEPPARFSNGHFKWFALTWEQLPGVVKCPALRPGLLDPTDPEIDVATALESFVYTYALSYQTSGTCRSATPLVQPQQGTAPGIGGRNGPVPDPSLGARTAQQMRNATSGVPYVYAAAHFSTTNPQDPRSGNEFACWVQALHPSEVQSPGRTYYLADSRDYRPRPPGQSLDWPPAGINDGWYSGFGNKVFLGSRHFGRANVLYLDGRVTRDYQYPTSSVTIDPVTGLPTGPVTRYSTFETTVQPARVETQIHTMPVLMVTGWEYFFGHGGVTPQ